MPEAERLRLTKAAELALPAWGFRIGTPLTMLKYRENAVFAVEADDGRKYVLRVHRRGYHSDEELRSELLWVRMLSEDGIPTPLVIPTLTGDVITLVPSSGMTGAYQCDLLSWVPGAQLGAIEEQSFGAPDFIESAYEEVGRLAARIHLHSERWRPNASFRRKSWDEEGAMGRRAIWGYWGDLATLTADERSLLHRAEMIARRRLAEYGKTRNRYGLLHGDLVPENVLLDGERCTLIDFDDAGFGWYISEIAMAVFFQAGTPSYVPALRALLRGYRELRALNEVDLDMLDVMLFIRGLTLIGWIQTRSETVTALKIRSMVIRIATTLAESLSEDRPCYNNVKAVSELPVG